MIKLLNKFKNSPIQMKASFWFLFCSFLQRGISLITTPIFTRLLSTDEYGAFGVFMSWSGILTPIITLNLSSGVYSQGLVKFDKDRPVFSSSLQGLTLTLVMVWTAIYLIFHDSFNCIFELTTIQMIFLIIMIWLGCTFNFWAVDQRVDFQYKKLVFITILVSIIQPALSIVLIINGEDKVFMRILAMTIVQLLFYGWTFFSQLNVGKKYYCKKYWIYALKFNLPLLPHYLSLTVLASSDRIMIERIIGSSEAGIYNLAYSVAQIMVIFNTALLQTIEPWIYKKLKANKGSEISRIAYPTFIGIALVNIALIAFAPEVIRIFAPIEYYEAIWVIPSVAMSVYFMFLYTFFATFEFYHEKTSYVAGATVGGAILNIILNLVFIRIFGYMAAGYTTLVSYILFAILHYFFMRKICKNYMNNLYPYNLKIIIAISLGFMLFGVALLFTYNNPIIRYSFIIISLIIAFLYRNKIISEIHKIINMRKQEEE